MSKLWFAIGLLVGCGAGFGAQATLPLDEAGVEAARAQLNAERAQQNVLFAAQDDACLQKFAVTDCQKAVAQRQRTALAAFKRREVALNDALRQQRAQEQAKRTQEKLDARAAEGASSGAAVPQDREKALQEKIQNHPKPAASEPRSAKVAPAVDARAIEEKRNAYAAKQQELLKKRQERDKRLQEKGPTQTGIPTPP